MSAGSSPLIHGSPPASATQYPASPDSMLISNSAPPKSPISTGARTRTEFPAHPPSSYISPMLDPIVNNGVINAVPISKSPHLGADPLRHMPLMPPPAHVSPGQIATPDANKTYVHVSMWITGCWFCCYYLMDGSLFDVKLPAAIVQVVVTE
jgi:hypothetical protein